MSSSCSEMAGAIAARLFPRPSFTRTQRGAEHTRSRAAAWGRSHTSPLLQLEAALPPHPGPRVPLRGAGISMRLRTMTTSTSRFRARRSRIYMHEDIPSSSSSRSLSPTRSLPRSPLLARAHRVRPLSSLQLERAAAEEISLRRVHQPLDVRVARRLTRGRNPMSESCGDWAGDGAAVLGLEQSTDGVQPSRRNAGEVSVVRGTWGASRGAAVACL